MQALDNVDFDLRRGEVHALVGENGAGKSTLMKILAGVYTKDTGRILFDGQPVEIRGVHHARQLGISIIFQELSQVPQLTVAQNIFLGAEARAILGVLNDKTHDPAGSGSAGDVPDPPPADGAPRPALARPSGSSRRSPRPSRWAPGSSSWMSQPPSLTIDEAENLFRIIDTLRARDVGIVYISHRMDEVSQVADRITILRDGQNVGMFGVKEITTDEVVRLMVGRELEAVACHAAPYRWLAGRPRKRRSSRCATCGGRGCLNGVSFR